MKTVKITAAALAGLVLIALPAAWAAVVSNNFDTDPGWTGVSNQDGFNNYGYTNSAVAGGSPGEVGGRFQRRGYESFYGDTSWGGSFNLNQAFFASGKYDATNTGTMNSGGTIGHFSEGAADRSSIGVGFSEANILPFASFFRAYPLLQLSDGSAVAGTVTNLPVNGNYWFSYAYDPLSGVNAQGRLSLTITNATGTLFTSFVDLTSGQRAIGATFDAWGMYGGAANNTAEFGEVYIDDVLYAVPEPEPATVALLVTGAALCVGRRRLWRK
jgi:hypothetical protein